MEIRPIQLEDLGRTKIIVTAVIANIASVSSFEYLSHLIYVISDATQQLIIN